MARVLVIEDNPVNLELMVFLLQAHGHTTSSAPDGASGITLARREGPDLVICDIQMPVLDGHAVAGLMRADPVLSRIPLVAVTAAAMVGDRERALASGFAAHVSKPIDPTTFMALIAPYLPQGDKNDPVPSTEVSLGGVMLHPSQLAPRPDLLLIVVDDRAMLREFKQHLLEPAGYNVIGCESAEEALRVMAERPVDIVLSDVAMPGMSGFDLLRRVRAEPATATLPFVILTAAAVDEAHRAEGLALGADAYLVRPVDPQDLLQVLRRVLAEHLRG